MIPPRISILACCLLLAVGCLAAFAEDQEQIEMDVITVYGKETYRLRKEVFELLAPIRKEDLTKMKLKKRLVEEVAIPVPPGVAAYETSYLIRPAGEVPTISIVKTGALLYFLARKPEIENLKLEWTSQDGVSQEFYLKRVVKDQYVEIILPEGVYRMALQAEGMDPAFADSIVIRPGQISLVLVPVEEIKEKPAPAQPPPPPPVEEKVEAPAETVPAPPPIAPEKQISVRVVPLRKAVTLPEAQPTIVTRGRVTFKEQGLPYMQVRLYEKEVGFFDPYDPSVENTLLAVTATDSYGNFEFPPIDNDDGFLEGTRDPVIVLSLENNNVSVLKPFAMTKSIPYRYIIYQRENIQPDAGNLTVGEIAVNLRKERPVMLFQYVQNYAVSFSYPLRIIYPSGHAIRLTTRQLEVPADADFSSVREYLNFAVP